MWVNWFKNECFWHRFTCSPQHKRWPPQIRKRKCSNLLPSYLMQIGKCNFYSRTNIPTYLLPSVTQYFSGHLMLPEASIHGVALGNSTPEEYNEMGCAIVAGIEAGWVINVKSFELFWEFPMWSFFFHFHVFFPVGWIQWLIANTPWRRYAFNETIYDVT